jgi:hypothetical protein
MENNNYVNKDEIFEFPENYEEIANLALLNFEKDNKIDLNKLIKIGITSEEVNIKQNNTVDENNVVNEKNDLQNKKSEWEDFDSDDNNENDEEINKYNCYQAFEDEMEQEVNEEKNNEKNVKIEESINNDNKFSDIKLIKSEKEKAEEEYKNKNNEIDKKNVDKKCKLNENKKPKKLNLDNKGIRDMVSKINYPAPKWAANMTDEEFIKTVHNFISKKKDN